MSIRDKIRRAERVHRERLARLVRQGRLVEEALHRLREGQAKGVGADQVLAAVDLMAAEVALAEVMAELEAEAKR